MSSFGEKESITWSAAWHNGPNAYANNSTGLQGIIFNPLLDVHNIYSV